MQSTSTKGVQDETHLNGESNSLRTEQEIEISSYEQMLYLQTRIRPGESDAHISLGF